MLRRIEIYVSCCHFVRKYVFDLKMQLGTDVHVTMHYGITSILKVKQSLDRVYLFKSIM